MDPLPGERTLNARVVTPGGVGAVYVVKLHPQHEAGDVDLEVAALDHLARRPAAAARCPGAVRDPARRPGRVPVGDRLARVLTWLPGRVWADARPPRRHGVAPLGAAVARVDRSLAGFRPSAPRPRAAVEPRSPPPISASCSPSVADPERRAARRRRPRPVRRARRPRARRPPGPGDPQRRQRPQRAGGRRRGVVTGLLDFGDLCGRRGCAGSPSPPPTPSRPRSARPAARGRRATTRSRRSRRPSSRCCPTSCAPGSRSASRWPAGSPPATRATTTSWSARTRCGRPCERCSPDDEPRALARLRAACGYEPVPPPAPSGSTSRPADAAPVLGVPLADLRHRCSTVGRRGTPQRPPEGVVGVGRYGEHRAVYTTRAPFAPQDGERRRPTTADRPPRRRPLRARRHAGARAAAPASCAPPRTTRSRSTTAPRRRPRAPHRRTTARFFTLYGHLVPRRPRAGARAQGRGRRGDRRGSAIAGENGGWPPHVHVQLLHGPRRACRRSPPR